jgi:hypothetical protein
MLAPAAIFWKVRHQKWLVSINVWVGILGDSLISPHILPALASSLDCLNCLRTHLNVSLEDAPFNTRFHQWFQHDAVPPHCNRKVRQWLSESYLGRWLVTDVKLHFPGLHAHLTSLFSTFFFCLRIFENPNIYAASAVDTRSELWRRIQKHANEIRTTSGNVECLRVSFSRRAELCVRTHGHFEHFLYQGENKELINSSFVCFSLMHNPSSWGSI